VSVLSGIDIALFKLFIHSASFVGLSFPHVQTTIAIAINQKNAYNAQKIELCKIDVCNSYNIIRRTITPNKANQKTKDT